MPSKTGAEQQSGLWQRYKKFFHSQPPALQLVLLNLWLPAFIIIGFTIFYLGSFHSPEFHKAPVAVVRTDSNLQQVQVLSDHTGNTFDFKFYDTRDDALKALNHGDAVALLDPSANPADPASEPTITTESATGPQGAALTTQALGKIYAKQGKHLKTIELSQFDPAKDRYGMSVFYSMLPVLIAAYVGAMFVGMLGGPLTHRTRALVIVLCSLVFSLVANLILAFAVNAYDDSHFWAMTGFDFLAMLAIMTFINGFGYIFGRFVAIPAMFFFVMLSMPGAGGPFPLWMMPPAIDAIGPYTMGRFMIEGSRRILYGAGAPMSHNIIGIIIYLLIGVVLSVVARMVRERVEAQRMIHNRPTMYAVSQGMAMRSAMENRAKLLAHKEQDDALRLQAQHLLAAQHAKLVAATAAHDVPTEQELTAIAEVSASQHAGLSSFGGAMSGSDASVEQSMLEGEREAEATARAHEPAPDQQHPASQSSTEHTTTPAPQSHTFDIMAPAQKLASNSSLASSATSSGAALSPTSPHSSPPSPSTDDEPSPRAELLWSSVERRYILTHR